MSLFWSIKNYDHAFKYKIHQNMTARDNLIWKWYPTPGCNSHIHPRRDRVFARRVGLDRGNDRIANLVYWRMHPKEWDQVRGEYGRKHI